MSIMPQASDPSLKEELQHFLFNIAYGNYFLIRNCFLLLIGTTLFCLIEKDDSCGFSEEELKTYINKELIYFKPQSKEVYKIVTLYYDTPRMNEEGELLWNERKITEDSEFLKVVQSR